MTATVLDVHEVERGDVFDTRALGTQGRPHPGRLGGVGIGLEAPTGDHSIRARAATLAVADSTPSASSALTVDGEQRRSPSRRTYRRRCCSSRTAPRSDGGRRDRRTRPPHHAAFDNVVID